VLSFAGLWDRWKDPETGEPLASCTIIVTDANALTRPIHHRMPVLLDKADIESWLNGTGGGRTASTGRGGPPSHVAGVAARGTGDDGPMLVDEVAA